MTRTYVASCDLQLADQSFFIDWHSGSKRNSIHLRCNKVATGFGDDANPAFDREVLVQRWHQFFNNLEKNKRLVQPMFQSHLTPILLFLKTLEALKFSHKGKNLLIFKAIDIQWSCFVSWNPLLSLRLFTQLYNLVSDIKTVQSKKLDSCNIEDKKMERGVSGITWYIPRIFQKKSISGTRPTYRRLA